jgi:hypothetical protein
LRGKPGGSKTGNILALSGGRFEMEKVKIFMLGLISAILLLVLLGAGPQVEGPGRYQVSIGGGSGNPVIVVLDTHTGKAKWGFITSSGSGDWTPE